MNTKGHDSVQNVGRTTVLNLCTWSDDALHLYQVSGKYLERFQNYGEDTFSGRQTDSYGKNKKSSTEEGA